MKTIEFKSKFELGDFFWIMENNKPERKFVNELCFQSWKNMEQVKETKVTYRDFNGKAYNENLMYHTKNELINNL